MIVRFLGSVIYQRVESWSLLRLFLFTPFTSCAFFVSSSRARDSEIGLTGNRIFGNYVAIGYLAENKCPYVGVRM